ncbi:diaminopimelate decarboxylase [Phenylobacterium sp.]|uniref:diaminopimelate decarboxylase n=1 Tax=Phenylobacterium sp. TaxID=1871053 RepID=UPI0025EB3783|nr:diaminopimelate decarboxylase [Phenylobacterium sp.]
MSGPQPAAAFWWTRDDLGFIEGRLHLGGRDLGALAAAVEGPLHVVSEARVHANLSRLREALASSGCPTRAYYAIKANRFEPLLRSIARTSRWGADICSPNELDRALDCGFAPADISFTGTAVANRDLERLLAEPDLTINCDSVGMIRRIGERAPGRAIGVRVNPERGTGYAGAEKLTYAGAAVTKFGIYRDQWADALAMARAHGLSITSLHFHVGCGYLSRELDAWEAAVASAASFLEACPGVRTVNVGGGLGVPHREGDVPLDLAAWSAVLRRRFAGRGVTVAAEPGEYIVKDAGVLLLQVVDVERKKDVMFAGLDGGFNLAPEPAYYELPCEPVACAPRSLDTSTWRPVSLAGNINEALDVWAHGKLMPELAEGDRIALINAGAYGASMASNHCMRGDFTEMLLPA